MSQSLLYPAFGVREGYEYVCTKYLQGGIEFTLTVKQKLPACPHCRSEQVIRKGKRYRRIQTVPIGFKPVTLKTEVPACECKRCGKTFEVSPPWPSPM
jgi:transposase